MALHKDKNGNYHDDMDGAALAFFPSVLGPYTPLTDAEVAALRSPKLSDLVEQALATARAARLPIISILDGLQASALATGNTARATAIETAKQGLRDITKIDLSACTTAEEMQATIYAAYMAISQAAPVEVQTAFAQVVSA